MIMVDFHRPSGRLFMVAEGFWTVDQARSFREKVRNACAQAAGTTLRIQALCDMSHYSPQSQQVSEINDETAEIMRQAQFEKHAVVINSALLKLQARRHLTGTAFEVFDTLEESLDWLGWERSYPQVVRARIG